MQISAPCSPWRNCESVQFWDSMPIWIHWSSVHDSNGVPVRSTFSPKPFGMFAAAFAITTAAWSTSIDQSRSVVTFHCDVFAFS